VNVTSMTLQMDQILSSSSATTINEEMSPASVISTVSSSPGMTSLPKTIVLTIYNELDKDTNTLNVLKEASRASAVHPEIYTLIEIEKDFDSRIMRSRSCYETRTVAIPSGKPLLSAKSFSTAPQSNSPPFTSLPSASAKNLKDVESVDDDENYLLAEDTLSVSTGNDQSMLGDDSSSPNDSTDADSIGSSSFRFHRTNTYDSTDDLFLTNALNHNKIFSRVNRPTNTRSGSQLTSNGGTEYDANTNERIADAVLVPDEVGGEVPVAVDPPHCMYSVPLLSCKTIPPPRKSVHTFEGF